MVGPGLVGAVSGIAGDSLKIGILAAIVFPLLGVIGGAVFLRKKKKTGLPDLPDPLGEEK